MINISKFNKKTGLVRTKPKSPITTVAATPDLRTNEGAVAWSRDPQSELFLLGLANFVAEDTFYEDKLLRDKRFEALVTQVAVMDPTWLEGYLPWLRSDANMRSAPVVGAAIAVKSMVAAKIPGSRRIAAKVPGRADEPGELLSYWISRWGDKLPMPLKRGLAQAVVRLYTQRSLLKWDTPGRGLRFSNVIQLVHPHPQTPEQRELFKYAMERVYKDNVELPELLRTVSNENEFRKAVAEPNFGWANFFSLENRSDMIRAAGLTWQDFLPRVPERYKAAAWETLIPTMGFQALLMNLRNFDEAGISPAARKLVTDRLANPEKVAQSKMFPFRFLVAHRNVRSLNWGPALEAGLDASLANVPELPGRTLIMVDRSGSMNQNITATPNKRTWRDSVAGVTLSDLASIFGTALALRNPATSTLVEFGGTSREIRLRPGDSLLRTATKQFTGDMGATYLARAVRTHFNNHDRVVVITDEQYHDGSAGSVVPGNIPVYTFNLAGYQAAGGVSGEGNRHTFGGLTDKAFQLIPMLEAARSQHWPWEAGE